MENLLDAQHVVLYIMIGIAAVAVAIPSIKHRGGSESTGSSESSES